MGREIRVDEVREVEVGVLFNLDSAKALRELLDDVIAEAESLDAEDEPANGDPDQAKE